MFSREIFSVTVVLRLYILRLKAVTELTARQTRTSFAKFIKKICSIEFLTTQIELLLPTFKSWTVHKFIEYLTLGLAFEISITVQQLTFLTHPLLQPRARAGQSLVRVELAQ